MNVNRTARGEMPDFDTLIDEYRDNLIFFINGYVNNYHSAEDIASDTFAWMLVNGKRYDSRASFKTFLFTVARSKALDFLRHNKVIEFAPLDEADAYDGGDIEAKVIENERKRALHRALSSLPEDMRTAIYLVYFEDMSYNDAASVMKKSKKQVDNLLFRAKNELRASLGKDELFNENA